MNPPKHQNFCSHHFYTNEIILSLAPAMDHQQTSLGLSQTQHGDFTRVNLRPAEAAEGCVGELLLQATDAFGADGEPNWLVVFNMLMFPSNFSI